ncbi:hypothetical protein KDA11_03565 [Candidatus Saccharibacteria bacterium]|nr:hypothetical protein [Candidatus Saccharibacteria bacterium]
MSTEAFIPGLHNSEVSSFEGAPGISEQYRNSLEELVFNQVDGVTQFLGGPLDLDDNKRVWLSPVEVDDGESYSYFQLIYVNTDPVELQNDPSAAPVSLLEVDEAGYKLTPPDHPGYIQLMNQFSGKMKQILMRHCNTGMAYYPRAITPNLSKDTIDNHFNRLITALGIQEPEVSLTLSKPADAETIDVRDNILVATHARKYNFRGSNVHSYGLMLEDDPWKYYEVFTPHEIEDMPKEDILLRVDSGCDIGQIFDDRGCDCREQLHTALTQIQEIGTGAVIHIPAQDGRGFGAATKMETEGLKRGIEVATNKGETTPYDTISAAQVLLGREFDIRTYEGAGRILGMLGVRSIFLQTDNRLKAEGLAQGGISVTRKPTNTTGARGAQDHIEAKHNHKEIYYMKDEV